MRRSGVAQGIPAIYCAHLGFSLQLTTRRLAAVFVCSPFSVRCQRDWNREIASLSLVGLPNRRPRHSKTPPNPCPTRDLAASKHNLSAYHALSAASTGTTSALGSARRAWLPRSRKTFLAGPTDLPSKPHYGPLTPAATSVYSTLAVPESTVLASSPIRSSIDPVSLLRNIGRGAGE